MVAATCNEARSPRPIAPRRASRRGAPQVLNKCPQDADAEVKKTKREEYAAGWMKATLTWLEAQFAKTATPFLHEDLGFADLHLYMVVDMVLQGQFDYVPASYMDQFPGLLKSCEAVKASPLVAEYLAAYPN